MDQLVAIALVLTIIIAAITGASFWQGVGVFIFMFLIVLALVQNDSKNK